MQESPVSWFITVNILVTINLVFKKSAYRNKNGHIIDATFYIFEKLAMMGF